MTFAEYKKERQLTASDYKAFRNLASDKNFQRFREIVEDFQVQRAFNLISGHVHHENIVHEKKLRRNELLKYSGAFDLWKKVLDLVDNSADLLGQLEEENNEEIKT